MKRKNIIIVVVALVAICCIGSLVIYSLNLRTPEGQADATARAVEREAAKEAESVEGTAVAAVEQTEEARPTDTPGPTDTPEPTSTPEPTETPVPTNTPEPPKDPIVITGSGDEIVDVEKWEGAALAYITGNSSSRYFGVEAFDAEGNPQRLVNTTDPYEGIGVLDWGSIGNTVRFGVESESDWTIEVLPLESARVLTVPGEISGTGNEVVFLDGEPPDLITVTGNAGSKYFGVTGWKYGSGGRLFHSNNSLLVNTTDPYEGTSIVGDAIALEVTAVGDWTIVITEK